MTDIPFRNHNHGNIIQLLNNQCTIGNSIANHSRGMYSSNVNTTDALAKVSMVYVVQPFRVVYDPNCAF